ncbi:MAG: prolyl-tRNA synthetase associated domain-containing protein [Pseudomonadota bacterium]
MTTSREEAREDGPLGIEALYALFDRLAIPYAHHDHPPFFTVADSKGLRDEHPGAHVKNMFLKGKKGDLWLVTCLEDRAIRIRDLEKALGAKGLSFGKSELLWEHLGVLPGAVTPFALINDRAGAVRFAIDAGVLAAEVINAHPLHNEATTAIAAADLQRFLEAVGHRATVVDFDALEEAAAAHRAAQAGAEGGSGAA